MNGLMGEINKKAEEFERRVQESRTDKHVCSSDVCKPHPQKAYEKLMMAKRNPELLNLWIAKDEDGEVWFVLMVGSVPIAKILKEPAANDGDNGLTPLFEESRWIKPMFEKLESIDERHTTEEFSEWHRDISIYVHGYLADFEKMGFRD
jgi:hypothetical protein